jgi:type IV pilus assembly protein PilF
VIGVRVKATGLRWLHKPCVAVALLLVAVLGLSACQTAPVLTQADAQRVDVRLQLASAYLERGQPDVALTQAQLALDVDPHSAQAYNVKAMALMGLHQLDAAQQAMRQATTLAPTDLSLQHNLAWVLCASDDVDGALSTFEAVIAAAKATPTDATLQATTTAASQFDVARTYLSLGVCALQAQRPDVAMAAFDQAQHSALYADAARFGMATMLVQTNDWPGAMRVLAAMSPAQRATPAVQDLQTQIDAQFERAKALDQTNHPTGDAQATPNGAQ